MAQVTQPTTPNIIRVTATTTQSERDMTNQPTIARPQNDQQVAEAVAKGFGALVSWGYENSWSGVTATAIRDAMAAANVDCDVPDLTAAHAVRTGCGAFRKQRMGGEVYRAEISDKTKEEITISVQKQVKEGKKTNWVATETLHYVIANHGNTGDPNLPDSPWKFIPVSDAAKYLIRCVNKRATYYTGLEFTRWVLKPILLGNSAVKLQDIDGLYYMIEPKMELVSNLRAACTALGGIRFRKRSLIGDRENIEDMQDAARETLMERIDAAKQTLKDWEAKSRIKKTSETALYKELDSIQSEAETLASALGFAVKELTDAIGSAKNRAIEMIDTKNVDTGMGNASNNSVQRWKNLLTAERLLAAEGGIEIYTVSVEDAIAGGIPEATAGRGYYYRDGQIHARALAQMGYFGSVEGTEIIIQTL